MQKNKNIYIASYDGSKQDILSANYILRKNELLYDLLNKIYLKYGKKFFLHIIFLKGTYNCNLK